MSLSVEEMRNSTTISVVAYAEFANSTRALPNHLFCFFEGKDNPYYVPRIKKYTNDYHPIKCGGRSKVLEVYELIKNQAVYSRYKKAFFIDRDFNEAMPEQNPPIFETPCYSIENLYVSSSIFKEILSNEFHLSETTNPLHQKYFDLYQQRQDNFHDAVLLFNAWYSCLIDRRNNEIIQTGVQLANKFPRGLISISMDEVLINYDFNQLKEKFPSAIEVNEENLAVKIEEFRNCDKLKTFRGKYEMEFLIKFIELMISNAKENEEDVRFSFDGALNNERAISVFTNYAETPEILYNYLESVTSNKF
ncbi:DUF4435 domain-containing protein [Flavobacterium sp.]|jgi:hypothetical protein|uniref:DUF4435 domain-containing protein n=1 Tax=Flavobacterium sp. TaxID=239 RepID=UPI0037C10CDC